MALKIICLSLLFCKASTVSAVSLRHARTEAPKYTGAEVEKEFVHKDEHDEKLQERRTHGHYLFASLFPKYTDAEVEKHFVHKDHHDARLKAKRSHGHHLFAELLICLILSMAGAFSMAYCSNKILVVNTWLTLDTIVVVVIASTAFYVIQHLFDKFEDLVGHGVLLHIAYAVGIFLAATFCSYPLRESKIGLGAFNGVIFWVVLLAKGGAINEAQAGYTSTLTGVILVTMASLAFCALLIYVTHLIKPEHGWYDDVEVSLAAGGFAGGLCTAVGMMINGHIHDGESTDSHLDFEKTLLHNAWALLTCLMAIFLTPVLSNMKEKASNYWYGRFLAFLNGLAGILPYFTVNVGAGAFLCHLLEVDPASMAAKLVHAMAGELVGLAMILACAFIPFLRGDSVSQKNLAGLMLGFGGFMVGYGWAALLVNSIDELVKERGWEHHKKVWVQMLIILFVNAILVPVYVIYLKPVIIDKTEAKSA